MSKNVVNEVERVNFNEAIHNRIVKDIVPEPIKLEHLNDVVDLHYKILHWSITGQLGKDLIHELYTELFNSGNYFGYVYYQNGKLLGFVSGVLDYADLRAKVAPIYYKRFSKLLFRLFLQPSNFVNFFESKYIIPKIYEKHGIRAEACNWITDTENFLSPFVAFKLMETMMEHYKKLGIDRCIGQSVIRNPRAHAYYVKARKTKETKLVKTLWVHNIYIFEC